ncbi:L,D-transpeptidase family protein [Microbacterium sp. GXF7504]
MADLGTGSTATGDGSDDEATTAAAGSASTTDAGDTGAPAAAAEPAEPAATTVLDAPPETDAEGTTPVYAWAPEEPKKKKRHLGLLLGIPGGVLAVAAIAASLVLIAPGTAVAGVHVGGLTAGAAADVLTARLASTAVEVSTPAGDATLTGAELGASIDAETLAEEAFAEHPLWNVTQWNAEPISADVTIDPEVAEQALRAELGDLYVDPTDAQVVFDAETASYTSVPAVTGEGIDLEVIRDAVEQAFNDGSGRAAISVEAVPVEAPVTTEEADQTVATLNAMLDVAGFYVGEERTVPLDRAQVASWLTVADVDGALEVSADAGAIQAVVDLLPGYVDRAPVDARVVVNSAGEPISDITPGVTGRTLGDTNGVAAAFAEQLATGNGQYVLPVTETAFATTSVTRSIEVNLSTQRTYLLENGEVVGSYTISSGLAGTPTPTGRFKVFAHVRMQDMGALCYNPNAVNSYCTKNVPWVTYFAPDIAFHGASNFRSSLGYPQSHGCVNMWNDDARFVYEWAANGTEVWVHY